MFIAKKQETVLEAQTCALYAHRYQFFHHVPYGYEIAETTPNMSFRPLGLRMFVAKKQETVSEAQSRALYAPLHPLSHGYPSATNSRERT